MSDMVQRERLELAETVRLKELEQVIERGQRVFLEVGEALSEIRDRRLYRETHRTFEDYLAERWGMSRRHGYRAIEAADVARDVPTLAQNLGASQLAELAPVPREKRAEVAEAVKGKSVRETRDTVRNVLGIRVRAVPVEPGMPTLRPIAPETIPLEGELVAEEWADESEPVESEPVRIEDGGAEVLRPLEEACEALRRCHIPDDGLADRNLAQNLRREIRRARGYLDAIETACRKTYAADRVAQRV